MKRALAVRAVGMLVSAAVAAGCASGEEPETPDEFAVAAEDLPADEAEAETSGETTADGAVENPVIDRDFPDPDVLEVDGRYYAYATNANLRNVQMARSEDLVEWEVLDVDALPQLPSWVIPRWTWAPEVTQIGPEQFVMYPTVRNFQPALQCIVVATATAAEGPFEVVGDGPLLCPEDQGGAIDASTFLAEDGTRYLLWKNDGNAVGVDTWIYAAPLTEDGLELAAEPTRLIKQDQTWEGDLVEAPTLVERDGTYYLLYSANAYGGPEYVTGWARGASPLGPFTKSEEPLLSTEMTDGLFLGPGGQDVVVGPDGEDHLVFHDWNQSFTYRGMNVLPLEWEDGEPVVDLPAAA